MKIDNDGYWLRMPTEKHLGDVIISLSHRVSELENLQTAVGGNEFHDQIERYNELLDSLQVIDKDVFWLAIDWGIEHE